MNGSDVRKDPQSWKTVFPDTHRLVLCLGGNDEGGIVALEAHGLISSIMYYSVTLELSNFSTKQRRRRTHVLLPTYMVPCPFVY
eukprot:06083.XXX_172053_172304_1 [CDS] Oithona nana genome sequencing.